MWEHINSPVLYLAILILSDGIWLNEKVQLNELSPMQLQKAVVNKVGESTNFARAKSSCIGVDKVK